MYSQENEEQVILEYFGGYIGRFLDIGAYDGKTFSNTLALTEKGWTGVLVEGSPRCFALLEDTYKDVSPKQAMMVCACMDGVGSSRLRKFHDSAGSTATLVDSHYQSHAHESEFFEVWIPTISPAQLNLVAGMEYDFVNVDVEGVSWEVLASLEACVNFKNLKLLCVEADRNRGDIVTFMERKGFRLRAQFAIGANLIYETGMKWR
jgi:FkbM family methyltransferase